MTLKRGKPLRADPAKVAAWRQRSRKRLPARSAKRIAAQPERDEVRESVFKRDGYRCQWPYEAIDALAIEGSASGRLVIPPPMLVGGHTRDLTYHHLRKASAGGPYTVDNGLCLCSFHNALIEDFPIECEQVGLVVRRG